MAVILSAVENMDHGNLDVKTSILIWMMGSQRHKLGRFKDKQPSLVKILCVKIVVLFLSFLEVKIAVVKIVGQSVIFLFAKVFMWKKMQQIKHNQPSFSRSPHGVSLANVV